jgi:hypothetical protein
VLVQTLDLAYGFILMEYTPRGNLLTIPMIEYRQPGLANLNAHDPLAVANGVLVELGGREVAVRRLDGRRSRYLGGRHGLLLRADDRRCESTGRASGAITPISSASASSSAAMNRIGSRLLISPSATRT